MKKVQGTLATGAVLVTLCACEHSVKTDAAPSGAASASAVTTGASKTGGSATSGTPTPVATGSNGLPVVSPAADSPALKTFTAAQVTGAMSVAQMAALAGISDTTLVVPAAHTLPDFASVEQYLTPSGKTAFEGYYQKAEGANGDVTAANQVYSYAFFQTPSTTFIPDSPVKVSGQDVSINPQVTTGGAAADGSPTMVISGSVDVGFYGTDKTHGGHGIMVISRTFSYTMEPTGDPSQPYAIDGWDSSTQYASKIKPASGA